MGQVNFKKKIFFSIVISLISFFLIFLTIKLSQKKQENRSQAATENQLPSFILDSPYSNSQTNSFKGMIHCHSNISDANKEINPTKAFQFYKNLGYDFISLTDHLNYPLNNASKIKSLQENNNTGVNILLLPGIERFVDNGKNSAGHINTISSSILTNELNQAGMGISVDELKNDDSNKIWIINHPGGQNKYWTDDKLNKLSDYNGIEIWNHGNNELYWDKLLTFGKKIWGFSSDDCHNYGNDPNCGSSFIHVFSQNLTKDDIFDNIKKGNFYSGNIPKNQPKINLKIITNSNTIIANTDIGATILFISTNGKTIKQSNNDTALSYVTNGDEKYIRVKATKLNSKVWSNPIFIKKIIKPIISPSPTPTIDDNVPNISFKISLNGINPKDQECFDQLKTNLEIVDYNKNKSQLFSNINIKPIDNEVNSNGDRIFLIENLKLDSSIFTKLDQSILIKVKGPFHLKQKMCVDNQKEEIKNNSNCNINLLGNKIYDFSEYPLRVGDIDQNGIINALDFSLAKHNLGNEKCNTFYDLNLDGIVNSIDLSLIKKTMLLKDEE